ncbi:MAG: hypothetical protein J7M18_03830 [Candidatus Eremiobacteraeota bacterium]|nr:hypothetical protein [Candidatus Eremiobacteraeota bacterium]
MDNIGHINPGINRLAQVQQKQALDAAFHRGDIGRLGMKEMKKDREKVQDGVPRVLKKEKLPGGLVLNYLEDGRTITVAPNGVIKEKDPDGATRISLPNGMLIEYDREGNARAFDPTPGRFMDVKTYQKEPTHQKYFKFKDAEGNKYLVTSRTLRFQIKNPTGSVIEKVHTSGSIHIETKTIARGPRGRFQQDEEHIYIEKDGYTHEYGSYIDNVKISRKGVEFDQRGDIHVELDFPYEIPYQIHGPAVEKPPVIPSPSPEPAPEPEPIPPPVTPVPTPPVGPGGFPGSMTPSGVIRKVEQDGSLYIGLPNGLMIHRAPDGTAKAYDSRTEQVLPVEQKPLIHPGGAKEIEFIFNDSAGNKVIAYSNSLDFMVSSPDNNTHEVVFPNGTILILSKTFDTEGKPTKHKVAVLNNGMVNTFGEKGVCVGYDRVIFGNQIAFLPYPIPPYQPFIGSTFPVPPFAGGPVSGNYPEGFEPDPQKAKQPAQHPPVHRGIWKRIKDFFQGEGKEKQQINPSKYPCQCYPPYATNYMMGALGSQMAMTSALTMMTVMSTMPMMFYMSPFIW